MLNVTRLLCGEPQPADGLRYGLGAGASERASGRRPVVVWNVTRRCNLSCVHCYSNSDGREYPGELTLGECQAVIRDLAEFKVPAVLLSGGEPMLHPHFFEIAEAAVAAGLRVTLSTNGTRLNREAVRRLKGLGLAYVGISLDGIGAVHDRFRGRPGAFDRAVTAFRLCREEGQ
ncbi:MAG: radical SAM protein, partial [Verrucomicrobiia bacterium]